MPKIATERAGNPEFRAALEDAGLPTADLDRPGRFFIRYDEAGMPLAWGGLEVYGARALLRSVVVANHRRGQGCGRAVCRALIEEARARGLECLWLFTATAPNEEFANLCPSTAVCMKLPLWEAYARTAARSSVVWTRQRQLSHRNASAFERMLRGMKRPRTAWSSLRNFGR
ncbi:MAG: GNAT family N-acetyltransferase [Rhodospirillaceae bacterium]